MQVEYPHYRKDIAHDYKVISNESTIAVYRGFDILEMSIKIIGIKNAYLPGSEDATEAEFLEAYYEVRKKLDNICLIKL